MRVAFLLAFVSLAFAGPAKLKRRFIPQEKNPDYKRYIPVENPNGGYEFVDLRATQLTASPRVEVSDVEYDLYTTSNLENPVVITANNVDSIQSVFNPAKRSVFVIHGWHNNRNSSVNSLIKEAIFINYDINLFIVDWSGLANQLYLIGRNSVVPVGQVVGAFINLIQEKYNLDGDSFALIGHSLGAHVAGSAGATVTKQVGTIFGLDPAGPLFSMNHPEERLDENDAKMVQVIHTDGILLGMGSSLGDIDYFPNGGMYQPGCGVDLTGTCSHGKAYRYMAEALTRGAKVFEARFCSDWNQFLAQSCSSNPQLDMGDITLEDGTGDYFLETNPDAPYGKD